MGCITDGSLMVRVERYIWGYKLYQDLSHPLFIIHEQEPAYLGTHLLLPHIVAFIDQFIFDHGREEVGGHIIYNASKANDPNLDPQYNFDASKIMIDFILPKLVDPIPCSSKKCGELMGHMGLWTITKEKINYKHQLEGQSRQ
ncbi:hypothetical protein ACJX0J_010173 [Zea mays]